MFELYENVIDLVTQKKSTIVHMETDENGRVLYILEPHDWSYIPEWREEYQIGKIIK